MSLPKHPEYKVTDSKLVAEVPKDWQLVPLRRLLPVIESGTSVNALDNQPEEGKPSVLKTSCVYTSRFRREECKEIVEEELGRATCPVKKDSLIVSRMNTPDLVGAAGLADSDIDHLYLPDRLWQVRIGELTPAFAYYWTQSKLYRDQVKAACSGTSSSMQNLSQEAFVSFFLCRPEPEEQNQIVNFLDRETAKIDALIAEQQRLIELLQEKRQAVISHAVTKGLNQNALMKDTGVEWIGKVPEHWAIKPLKHLATVQTGVAKGKDLEGVETADIPYLRVANVQDGYLDLEEVHLMQVPIASIARYLLQIGDVLMNEGGDFDKLGRGCIWQGQIETCVHQNHVFAVRPHSISGEWLNAYTTSKAANSYFISWSKQSTNLASISSTNLMGLLVPVPPSEEVSEILNHMSKRMKEIDDLRLSASQAVDLLQERRSALISAAVTGQIDVRGLVPEAVEQ
jgi:type I restriction enzyme S subunit